jgi:hypothetical protein
MTTTTASTCYFCSGDLPRIGTINGCHWTGTEYVRVDLCSDCYGAGRLASAPRRPRQRRTAPAAVPATDWNMLVAFTQGRKGR